MLRAIVGGFLAGPVVVIVLALAMWKPWAVATVVAVFVVAVVALAATQGQAKTGVGQAPEVRWRGPAAPDPGVPAGSDATLTSTPTPVRATARENLASENRWRRAFTGWRYGERPERD